MSKSLLEKLKEHSVKPYHMPGHKRHTIADGIPYDIDITEIEGFDNLHELGGILKDVAQIKKGTADEELAKEFLEYYCKVNNVDSNTLPEPEGALKV